METVKATISKAVLAMPPPATALPLAPTRCGDPRAPSSEAPPPVTASVPPTGHQRAQADPHSRPCLRAGRFGARPPGFLPEAGRLPAVAKPSRQRAPGPEVPESPTEEPRKTAFIGAVQGQADVDNLLRLPPSHPRPSPTGGKKLDSLGTL